MAPVEARALVLRAHGETPRIETLTIPDPGRGEVRVRMVAAGLCHTDVAAVRDARFTPMVLGHEGAGVVDLVGAGVTHVVPGDRVLLCWKTPCGACHGCATGAPELCEAPQEAARPRTAKAAEIGRLLATGCFSERVLVPAAAAIPIPPALDLAAAALVGCAVATGVGAALYTAAVRPGQHVVVWGAGGIGLNAVSGAVLAQAGSIVAVDPDARRRNLAAARGATAAIAPEDAIDAALDASGGRGAAHVIETVGSPQVMAEALDALAVGGQLTIVGATARDAQMSFAPRRFLSRQQRIVGCIYGSIRPGRDLPLLLGWLADGLLRVDDLLGVEVGLDALPDLFDTPITAACVRPIVRYEAA